MEKKLKYSYFSIINLGIVNSSSCLSKTTLTLSPIEIFDILSATILDIILAPSFNVIDATTYGTSDLKAGPAGA